MSSLLLPITLATAGALGLIGLILGLRVTMGRAKHNVTMGDGGNPDMIVRMRTHANFAEYVPLCAKSVDATAFAIPLFSMSPPKFPTGPVIGKNHCDKSPVSIFADHRRLPGPAFVLAVYPEHPLKMANAKSSNAAIATSGELFVSRNHFAQRISQRSLSPALPTFPRQLAFCNES